MAKIAIIYTAVKAYTQCYIVEHLQLHLKQALQFRKQIIFTYSFWIHTTFQAQLVPFPTARNHFFSKVHGLHTSRTFWSNRSRRLLSPCTCSLGSSIAVSVIMKLLYILINKTQQYNSALKVKSFKQRPPSLLALAKQNLNKPCFY